MNKIIDLLRNFKYSLIVGFLPNLMGILLIPLYTYVLSTEDYGIIDLIKNTIQLAIPILTLQIQYAILRFSLDQKELCQNVFCNAVVLYVKTLLILMCICALVAQLHLLDNNYIFIFLISYIALSMYNLLAYYCRGRNQLSILVGSNLCSIISSLICYVLFLVFFKWGVCGYMLAYAVGLFFNSAYIIGKLKPFKLSNWKYDKELTKEMIKFSAPLVFSALSWWLNNVFDRYVLYFFTGAAVVGVYALAYKLPTILKVMGDIVSMAFSISAIKEFDYDDKDGFIGKCYSAISCFFVFSCSCIIFVNVFLAKIMYAGDFFFAWKYVPMLLVAVMMSQMSVTCENILIGAKSTKIISKTAILGLGVNLILNFLLIPLWGSYGAAIATTIGFGVQWMFRYISLRKIVLLKDNLRKEVLSYILLICQSILAFWGNQYLLFQGLIILIEVLLYRKELVAIFENIVIRRGEWIQ